MEGEAKTLLLIIRTLYGGIDKNGKRIELYDDPRYQMCGNSVAIPCTAVINDGVINIGEEGVIK